MDKIKEWFGYKDNPLYICGKTINNSRWTLSEIKEIIKGFFINYHNLNCLPLVGHYYVDDNCATYLLQLNKMHKLEADIICVLYPNSNTTISNNFKSI